MTDNPFFKNYADEYARSVSHKSGEDLFYLSNMVENNKDICLDVATGTGYTAIELSKKCRKVVALDQTAAMLEKAKELARSKGVTNIEFVNMDFEKFNPAVKFDVITIRRALHHFTDKELFFRKCNSILVEGGLLIIADMLSPERDDKDIFNKLERIRDPTHVSALKERDYNDLSQKFGFEFSDKITSVEKMTVEDWLYPLKRDTEAGKRCIEFLNEIDEDTANSINYDRLNRRIFKQRIIIKFKKRSL